MEAIPNVSMKSAFILFNPMFWTEKRFLTIVIVGNLVLKIIAVQFLELTNDEVYYWTYALFPDVSHFDHPPFVGFIIQLFTLNLTFDSVFFIRLGALVLATANLLILYYTVKKLFGQLAGMFSVLLFTSSVYLNFITGFAILPDTPLIFFLFLAYWYLLPALINRHPDKGADMAIIAAGFFIGLAFLCKYHALYVWVGIGLYVLLHNRVWLGRPSFYIAGIITLLLTIPVLYWNFKNQFISFTFHENRVGFSFSSLDWWSFLRYHLVQVVYHNPVLYIMFIMSIVWMIRTRQKQPVYGLLLYLSVPLIVGFGLVSFSKTVLPHWSGPAYIGILMLTASYLSKRYSNRPKTVQSLVAGANSLFILALLASFLIINKGIGNKQKEVQPDRLGKNDITLDMYGWQQLAVLFDGFLSRHGIGESAKVKLVTSKWFPAAHVDYYVAYPRNIELYCIGSLKDIHKYHWINQQRSPILATDSVYYITTSQYFKSADYLAGEYFEQVTPVDTLTIARNGLNVKNFFIYRLNGFTGRSLP